MKHLHLVAINTYLPEKILYNDEFPGIGINNQAMFKGSSQRRHVRLHESAEEMFSIAAQKLAEENVIDLSKDIDCILTNVSLPDMPFTGCGAGVAKQLKAHPRLVFDLHSGGCVSFISMMDLARGLLNTHNVKNILICTAQTAAGRIFSQEETKKRPQAPIPGDGASVALFSDAGLYRISHTLVKCHPEYSADMSVIFDDGHQWWEPSLCPGYINFDEKKIAQIIMRGNSLVPDVMNELLKTAGVKNADIDALVTNQPNPIFLRNWREAMEIPKEKHFDTFETLGNLFQAGIPINLEKALHSKTLAAGNKILLGGFSHAGDYSAAALLEAGHI